MGLQRTIAQGLRPVTDLVYPPRCPSCGDAIAAQGGLCLTCWSELEVPGEPACNACQRPLGGHPGYGNALCYACIAKPPRHNGVIAATIYNDASRRLILAFKHGGKIALAPLLGRLVAARLPSVATEGRGGLAKLDPTVSGNTLRNEMQECNMPLIVPVPLHRWRLWRRGFNQSALLAREVARAGKGTLMVDALVRRKHTPSLGGLGRDERERALAGAIMVRSAGMGEQIGGRRVILVDDVLTSGATSDACVAALLDAGAETVKVACFARVVDG